MEGPKGWVRGGAWGAL